MQKRNCWIIGNTMPIVLRNNSTVFHSCWTKAWNSKKASLVPFSLVFLPSSLASKYSLSYFLSIHSLLCPWRGLQSGEKVSYCKNSMPSSRWDAFAIIFFLRKEAKTSWILQLCEDGSQAGSLTLNSQLANWRATLGKVRSSVSSSVKCLFFLVLRTRLWVADTKHKFSLLQEHNVMQKYFSLD